ncbi:MAG: serine/threonine-protein kinase [Desertimonas sp.]
MTEHSPIGRFRVLGLLGTGAFSAVYHAVDERIGSDVAIKLLADHHSLDPDIRERFIAEARLLRRLTSPHVVRLYELDETDRHQPFHVLEYVGGGNLAVHRRAMLAAGRRVTVEDVTRVVDDLTTALTVLHAERVVHRDLAPKNLLVRRAGAELAPAGTGIFEERDQLVLADLGISKDLGESSGLTAAAGTTGFAAPEQRAVGVIDERVDVFAASAVVVWLITGERPGDAVAADVAAAGFDHRLGVVLADALAADADERPATIAAWHSAVGRALGPQRSPGAAGPLRRRRVAPSMAVLAAVVALAVGVGVGWVLGGHGRDGGRSSLTVLGGGLVRAEARSGDVTVAFDGPGELVVGERATFTATIEGAAQWTWYGAGGQQVGGREAIDITPSSPGTLILRLVAVGPDDTATAEAELVVSGP